MCTFIPLLECYTNGICDPFEITNKTDSVSFAIFCKCTLLIFVHLKYYAFVNIYMYIQCLYIYLKD